MGCLENTDLKNADHRPQTSKTVRTWKCRPQKCRAWKHRPWKGCLCTHWEASLLYKINKLEPVPMTVLGFFISSFSHWVCKGTKLLNEYTDNLFKVCVFEVCISRFSRSAFSKSVFSRSVISRSAFSRSVFSRSVFPRGLHFRGLCFQATYLEWSGSGVTWIMKHQRDPWICDQSGFIGSFEGSWSEWSTIMDKSLKTNLHFWRFWVQTRREYNFTCLTSPPIQCWELLPAISSDFQHCTGWGGGTVTRFQKESSAFFKLQ